MKMSVELAMNTNRRIERFCVWKKQSNVWTNDKMIEKCRETENIQQGERNVKMKLSHFFLVVLLLAFCLGGKQRTAQKQHGVNSMDSWMNEKIRYYEWTRLEYVCACEFSCLVFTREKSYSKHLKRALFAVEFSNGICVARSCFTFKLKRKCVWIGTKMMNIRTRTHSPNWERAYRVCLSKIYVWDFDCRFYFFGCCCCLDSFSAFVSAISFVVARF